MALHPRIIDMSRAVDEEPRKHLAEAEGITLPLGTADYASSDV
ncbi:MAG: hypothetical protein ACPLRY_00825 [Candidatus Bathyarchaeales archaeon]